MPFKGLRVKFLWVLFKVFLPKGKLQVLLENDAELSNIKEVQLLYNDF
jgi:hypothetical protein